MYLKEAVIYAFGRFKDKKIVFEKGLNVIFGRNESGKTTLNWFLRGMLYGLDGGKKGKGGLLPPARKYQPWTEKNYGGCLDYVLDDGKEYRIERDFSTGTATVYDSAFNDITHLFSVNKSKTVSVGEKHLGIDETGFEKTVFVDQQKANPGDKGGTTLMDRLSNACLSGDEEVSLERARNVLQDAMREQVGTDKTRTKPLDIVLAEIESLEERKKELMEQKEEALDLERKLGEYRRETGIIQEEMRALHKAREVAATAQKAAQRKNHLKKVLELKEGAKKLGEEIDGISKNISELERSLEEAACFGEWTEADAVAVRNDFGFLTESKENLDGFDRRLGYVNKRIDSLNEQIESPRYDFFRHPENLNKALELSRRNKETEIRQKRILEEAGRILVYWIFSACTAIAAAVIGVAGFYHALAAVIPAASMWFFLYRRWKNKKREVSELGISKKELEKLYRTAGVVSEEELVKTSRLYNDMLNELAQLSDEAEDLQKRINDIKTKYVRAEKTIAEKLRAAGLIDNGRQPLMEHVEAFIKGVEAFSAMQRDHLAKRNELSGKTRELEFMLERISQGQDKVFKNIPEAEEYISSLWDEIRKLDCQVEEGLKQLREFCPEHMTARIDRLTDSIKESDSKLEGECKLLEEEYELLEEKLRKLQLDIREYETRVEGKDPSQELLSLEEEIEALEQKRQRLQDMGQALSTAIEVIDEAAYDIQHNYSPVLNNKLSEIIAGLTIDRYCDLRADDNMTLNTQAPESGRIVPVVNLSGGTVDQMYLALRIAVSDIISDSGESLPLILDEPFAQYDDARMEKTLEYLEEMAQKRQIIISTCKSRELEKALGKGINIIELN